MNWNTCKTISCHYFHLRS